MSPIVVVFAAVYTTGIVYWINKCFSEPAFGTGKEAIRAAHVRTSGGVEPSATLMRVMLVPYVGFLVLASVFWPIASWLNILGVGKKAEPQAKLAQPGDADKWCGHVFVGPICSCTLAPEHEGEHHHPKHGSWPNDEDPADKWERVERGAEVPVNPVLVEIVKAAEIGNVSPHFRIELTLKGCVVRGEIVSRAQVQCTHPGLLPMLAPKAAPYEFMYVLTKSGTVACVRLDEVLAFGSSCVPDPKEAS